MQPHGNAPVDLGTVQLACPAGESGGIRSSLLHERDGVREVHRRGARGEQDFGSVVEVVSPRGRQRVAHGRGNADRGGPAYREHANRVGDLARVVAVQLDDLAGKPALVEDDDAVVLESQDLLGSQIGAGAQVPSLQEER
jgi:hypothetical protein